MKKVIYTLALLGMSAGVAHAQSATDTSPDPAGSQTPAEGAEGPAAPADEGASIPADEAAPASAAEPAVPGGADSADSVTATAESYTDAVIDNYAAATVKVQKINADASLNEQQKQAQMATAVTEAGLEPQKFNEISKAVGADADLQKKVQLAIARHTQPSDG